MQTEFHLAFYCPGPLGFHLFAAHQAVLILNILNNCASSVTFVTLLLNPFSKSCMNKLNSTDLSTDDITVTSDGHLLIPSISCVLANCPFQDLPIYANDHKVETGIGGIN